MGSEAAKISDKLKLRLKCAGVEPLLVQPAEKERKIMKIVLWKKLQGKKLELWKMLPEEERGRQSLLSLGRRRSNATHRTLVWYGVASTKP